MWCVRKNGGVNSNPSGDHPLAQSSGPNKKFECYTKETTRPDPSLLNKTLCLTVLLAEEFNRRRRRKLEGRLRIRVSETDNELQISHVTTTSYESLLNVFGMN